MIGPLRLTTPTIEFCAGPVIAVPIQVPLGQTVAATEIRATALPTMVLGPHFIRRAEC